MTDNEINEAAAEAVATPRPRWRGSRARIGVLAAALGIIGAFLCLAVIAPPTVDAASWEDAVIAGAVSGGIVGGVAGSVVPGLGTGLGGLIGAGVGAIAAGVGYIIGNWGGDPSATAAEMGKWLANDQRNQTVSKLELGKTNAENVGELAQRAITYYERSSYYAAVSLYEHQTEADLAHTYDSDYVLDKAHVSDEMVGSVAGSYAVYNKILRQLDTVGAGYIGDYSGNSMTIGVAAAYNSMSSKMTYDNQQYIRLTSYCNTPTGKYVWLNATDMVIIWNLGSAQATGNVVITNAAGQVVFSEPVTLAPMMGYGIDLAAQGMASGRYNVQLPSTSWVWTANAAEDYHNSGTVAPGIAVYARSGDTLKFSWGWASLPANQGFAASGSWHFGANTVWRAVTPYSGYTNGGYPYISFQSTSGRDVVSAPIIDLKPMIESIWNVSRSWRQITYAASLAGQTSYQVLIDNGGVGTGNDGNVLYPPIYFTMPDYDQLRKMTPQELLVMYYAYLGELNQTFQRTNIMSPNNVNISTASFDLLIRGTVYYNGVQVVGNSTPFTLYTTLEGLTLRAGETASLTSAAHIITWADGYPSLMDYLRSKGNVQHANITYLDVGEGWTIHIDEIAFENQLVEEKELTVDKLNTYVPPDLPDLTGPPSGGDGAGSAISLCIIGICAGAVLLVVGVIADNSALAGLGIVAAVVCAAAWYVILNPIEIGLWTLANAPDYLRMWWR